MLNWTPPTPQPTNRCMLDGLLWLETAGWREEGADRQPAVRAALQTDAPENGGRHRLLLTGALAGQLAAAWQAGSGRAPLEGMIRGRLRCPPDGPAEVVVEHLELHLPPEVAERAERLLADRSGLELAWFAAPLSGP